MNDSKEAALNCDVCDAAIPPESGVNKVEAGQVEGDACDPCYAFLVAQAEAGQ